MKRKKFSRDEVPKWLYAYKKTPSEHDPLLKMLFVILLILVVMGGAFYFWYSSRLLPSALTDDDFKQSVISCYPSQFDLLEPWGVLRLETRHCGIVDVRVWNEGDYPLLKGLAMRCRPGAEELRTMNLQDLPKKLDLCEGELKRSELYQNIASHG